MNPPQIKTLVVGLGNPILTDDGVGVHVARAVAARITNYESRPYESPFTLHITEASVGGLRLMEMMDGYDWVILIDALYDPGVASGAVRRMTLDDLRALGPTQHSASAHDTSLVTALETGRRMGLPLPSDIVIYAIGVENVLDFSETMTPAVARAVPAVVTAVLDELRIANSE